MPEELDWHRPKVLHGDTLHIDTACGELKVTMNRDPGTGDIVEVFVRIDDPGTCGYAQLESMGRLITWGLRYGSSMKELIQQLLNIRCNRPFFGGGTSLASCADAVAKALYLET